MPNELTAASDTKMPDLDWFVENREALEARYGQDWIGIQRGQVVAHAPTTRELAAKLKSLGLTRVLVTRAHADAWQSYK